eukprot:403356641
MKKSEFSQRKFMGGKSIISRVFSFKKDKNIKSNKRNNNLFRGPLSASNQQVRGKNVSKFSKKGGDGFQNSYNQDFDHPYVSSGGMMNYLSSDYKTRNIDSTKNKNLNQNTKYVNSFNHHSTVLSQTREGDYCPSTPGQIKLSMKALQSSVSALLERAYLQQTTSVTQNPNHPSNNNNTGIIQYPSISQIQKLQQKWYQSGNISDLQNKLTCDNQATQQQLQQPLLDKDTMMVQSLFKMSQQESGAVSQFNFTSPPQYSKKLRMSNQLNNRNTKEIRVDNRVSKPRTEAKFAEGDEDQSPLTTKGNRLNSNYGKQLMSHYGYEVDETQLNQDEIKLFALLQDPNNEEELQQLLNTVNYQTLVNLHNTTGYSALHVATCNNNSSYTQILISHLLNSSKEIDNDSVQREDEDSFIEPNYKDQYSLLEKHINLSTKAKIVVEKWINQMTLGTEEFGGDLQLANNQGINCMHFASQGNQPKVLHYLSQNHNFSLEEYDANGCTPLHWACVSGSYQAVRYLLAQKANPNIQQQGDLLSPLHMTIKYIDETREIRTIHKLLIYGAFIDTLDENKMTPTDYVEHIEDEELRDQCITLINDVAFKSNGLFPCFKRCRRVNRSLKIVRSDPGFIQQDLQSAKSVQGVQISTISYDKIIEDVDFKQICPECRIIMTKRSRHCYSCQRCIERFDHHCDWIDNCVGIKNHQMFMMFIITLLLYMIFTICLSVDQIIFKFGVGDDINLNFFGIFPKQLYFVGVAQFLMGFLGLLCLIFLLPLGSLVFLQFQNICQNTTTYERFSKGAHKQSTANQSTTQTVGPVGQNGVTDGNTLSNNVDDLILQNHDEEADQLNRMTEDSDEIEAVKNSNVYETLKFSKSQNNVSSNNAKSSGELTQNNRNKHLRVETDNDNSLHNSESQLEDSNIIEDNNELLFKEDIENTQAKHSINLKVVDGFKQNTETPNKLQKSNNSRVNTTNITNRTSKSNTKNINFLSNCRIMCCQNDIKSQSELYYELIRRQKRKNDTMQSQI